MLLAAAAAFNLVCSGTLSHKAYQDEGQEPYSVTFRIDLDAKKYCNGDCKGLMDIAEVQPTKIILKSENVDTPREHRFTSETINRETGQHSRLETSGAGIQRFMTEWKGQCERKAFSGFPEFKTKF